eukprot:779737-Rhodomonas_salina.1
MQRACTALPAALVCRHDRQPIGARHALDKDPTEQTMANARGVFVPGLSPQTLSRRPDTASRASCGSLRVGSSPSCARESVSVAGWHSQAVGFGYRVSGSR